jgi:hypothetical protein
MWGFYRKHIMFLCELETIGLVNVRVASQQTTCCHVGLVVLDKITDNSHLFASGRAHWILFLRPGGPEMIALTCLPIADPQ